MAESEQNARLREVEFRLAQLGLTVARLTTTVGLVSQAAFLPRDDSGGGGAGGGFKLATTGGGGIPARVGTTPGSGTVTEVTYDGISLAVSGNTYTAYNLAATAVASSKYIMTFGNGTYDWVIFEDC